MNIELEEVVVQDVSDDALEMAAGGAQRGPIPNYLLLTPIPTFTTPQLC